MRLENWREEIDLLDTEIVELLNKRAGIAQKIGALKAVAGLPVVDPLREDEILRKLAAKNNGILKKEAIVRIFRGIIREAREIQIDTQAKISNGEQIS